MQKKITTLIVALCVLFSMCTFMVRANESCTPIAEGIYNGHTYKVFDNSMTWEEAKEYCNDLGGHLVTITGEEEQDFIEILLEDGQKKQYWIGMRTAGGPSWITGETYEYSNWDRGEPNNQHKASSDEDYVHIYNVANPAVWGSERFKWNDMFGDNTFPGEEDHFALKYVGFICEWDNVFSSFGSEISEWASDEIEVAYDKELIPESLVGEDLTQPITRAEFAAVSVKAYELMANTKALPAVNNPFTDTKDVEVLKAYNTGITTGISATEFAPNELLNREQAATMLTRVFKRATMKNWTIETDAQFKLDYKKPATFADDGKISEWAKDSVYFMAANEIINGVGGNKFAPQNTTTEEEATGYANATREQALIIATRMVENLK
ncbi:MAG: lectin-like protein [Clostridia bacterium]|nr:lectin-like protein [Clostridia bacterium]